MESDSRPELSSDLSGVVLKTSNLASSRSLKLTGAPSGKLTPRASALGSSPSFRRSSSFSRAHKKVDSRSVTPLIASTRWIYGLFSRRNIIPGLLLIGIWSYIVFLLHYRVDSSGEGSSSGFFGSKVQESDLRLHVIDDIAFLPSKTTTNSSLGSTSKDGGHSDALGQASRNALEVGSQTTSKSSSRHWSQLWPWRGKKVRRHGRTHTKESEREMTGGKGRLANGDSNPGRRQVHEHVNSESYDDFPMVVSGDDPRQGRLVGPFDNYDEKEHDGKPQENTCRRDGLFPNFIRDKTVVVVLHELSLTGAPLAMIELAYEMSRCKAKVSAVVLNRKGGLLQELEGRGIRVVNDKTEKSWNIAAKADLVVAGSASCSSWIGVVVSF